VVELKREKIVKLRFCKNYYIVNLCKNGKSKNYRVNRLVAEAFIPNPNNYPVVNHKNGNKLDNRVENLEWCSYSHNEKEAYKLGLKKPTWEGKCYDRHPSNKKIVQYNIDGEKIKVWNSIQEATDALHINNISAVCRGIQKTAGGYVWNFVERD
jgi:hypothetical protein